MKVILVMVTSLNGKITRADDPDIYSWTSEEDQHFFLGILQKHRLIVMGSGTYEAAKEKIKPDKKRRRIILTSHPESYKDDVAVGKIEFSSETPKALVKRLEEEGYDTMLLVGGGETNKLFFEAGLVTELFLTLEPVLFGKGKLLIGEGAFINRLRLISQKQLNTTGTLLLHYSVA